MDEIVYSLHSDAGKKSVLFISDEHILKAGEITGPIQFHDYRLNGLETSFIINVYPHVGIQEVIKPSIVEAFIVRRSGMYVFGDDPVKLLNRYVFC